MTRRVVEIAALEQGAFRHDKEGGADLLSRVLGALQVDTSALYMFDLCDPWEIDLIDVPVSISWTVIDGTVWLHTPDGQHIELQCGDTFLFTPQRMGNAHVIVASSDRKSARTPMRAKDLFRQMHLQGFQPGAPLAQPAYACWGGQGALTRVVSTAFGLNDRRLGALLAALPPLTVVRAEQSGNRLVEILSRLGVESEGGRPGFAALLTQVAQLLLVHIVRTYALSTGSALGWLMGLGDARIARALGHFYLDPGARWSVTRLARIAGMARSEFATHFNVQVGQTSMQYLRAWRIHLACEALTKSDVSVSALALDLGYQSEAAFRTAFRRITGQSPSSFRRSLS